MNKPATPVHNIECDIARSTLLKLSATLIVCAALTACGGSDDPPVASDSATQPAGGDTTDTTTSNGGDTTGGTGTGDTTTGTDDGVSTDPLTSGPLNGPAIPDGTAFAPLADIAATAIQMNCKSETDAGTQIPASSQLMFSPSTGEFMVDGETVMSAGFAWISGSREYSANREVAGTDGSLSEFFAKVDWTLTPSYYRFKQSQADFSFTQYECYAGLTVADAN